jgi:hypothetical protein
MHRPTLAARAPLAAGLLTVLVAAPVVASHIAPELVDEAQSCGPLTEGAVELVVALPEGAGSIADGEFEVDVTLDGGVADGSISFSGATLPVQAAFVAGTDSGNLYRYEEPVTEDDGLVAPDGSPIRDVSFCYVSGGDGSGTPTDDGSGDGQPSDADSGGAAASGDAQGGGGSEASPPATDTAAPRPASPAGTVFIALGLIALAGALSLRVAGQRDRSAH